MDYATRVGRHLGLVCDDQDRDAAIAVQSVQQGHDLVTADRIQIPGRLVGKEQMRGRDDGARDLRSTSTSTRVPGAKPSSRIYVMIPSLGPTFTETRVGSPSVEIQTCASLPERSSGARERFAVGGGRGISMPSRLDAPRLGTAS